MSDRGRQATGKAQPPEMLSRRKGSAAGVRRTPFAIAQQDGIVIKALKPGDD
jgi:hypothetical protein